MNVAHVSICLSIYDIFYAIAIMRIYYNHFHILPGYCIVFSAELVLSLPGLNPLTFSAVEVSDGDTLKVNIPLLVWLH